MKPLIETTDDIARLRSVAESWKGTPWVGDGAVKQTGASCSHLPYAILQELGHNAPQPPSRQATPRSRIIATCMAWLDTHTEHYQRVPSLAEVKAGDILLYNIGGGHMAIVVGDGEIMHSWQTVGAHFSVLSESDLSPRFVAAWRPITTDGQAN